MEIEKIRIKKPKEFKINISEKKDFEKVIEIHRGSTLAETKYDGKGILINNNGELKIYSLAKNLWNPKCLPELTGDLYRLPSGFYVGELVGKQTRNEFSNKDEFAATSARSLTKYSEKIEELAREQPLEIRIYHILEMEGKSLADRPLTEVREVIENKIRYKTIHPVEQHLIENADDLQQLALSHFSRNKEGLVVKRPSAPYSEQNSENSDEINGARNDDWLKIKKAVTFDLAVLGIYQTEKRLNQGWKCSNVLLGTYNEETGLFETIIKMTVPSKKIAEEIYQKLVGKCRYSWNKETPYFWQNYGKKFSSSNQVLYSPELNKDAYREKVPFLYVENPKQDAMVIEAGGMEITCPKESWHSCGMNTLGMINSQVHSLRQPIFVRYRTKKPLEATTTQQIKDYEGGM